MKVYYDLFQPHQSPQEGNETFEKILDNVGRITVPDDCDVGDLTDAVYKREEPLLRHCSVSQLSSYPHGTDMESPTLKQQRCDIDSKVPATTKQTPLIITFPSDESLVNKRKLEDLLKTTQIVLSESGTRKSERLAKVKPTKRCFLCKSVVEVEASHVFQKSDVSYKSQPSSDTVLQTLQVLDNWMKDSKWKRPFEIHGPMNLVWLCHQHSISFDHHAFCLKVDMSNRVLFHAFDDDFKGLVASANSSLLDPSQSYLDLNYVSRRAVGMRVLQSQYRANKYVDHSNPKSWEAIVDLSIAASEKGDGESSEEEAE